MGNPAPRSRRILTLRFRACPALSRCGRAFFGYAFQGVPGFYSSVECGVLIGVRRLLSVDVFTFEGDMFGLRYETTSSETGGGFESLLHFG